MPWDSPVTVLPGIGPRHAGHLRRLGVERIADLLQICPRRYEDRRNRRELSSVTDGEAVLFRATVGAVESRRIRRGLYLVRVSVDDDSGGKAVLVFFNLPAVASSFRRLEGRGIWGFGVAKSRGRLVEFVAPDWEAEDEDGATGGDFGGLIPVYPLVDGLTQSRLRSWVRAALERVRGTIPDAVPGELRERRCLSDVESALFSLHFPPSPEAVETSRQRLAYEELLALQLMLRRARGREPEVPAEAMGRWSEAVESFWSRLPFSPTDAQRRVVSEIVTDMARQHPMQRLLQGDVGSGKTAVSMAAMAVAAFHGCQSALMAPTELLAMQHLASVRPVLEGLGYRVDLLTGSRPASERTAVRQRLASGETHIVVGTHALFQESVQFQRLGLVVVDEQHRFGVLQRAALRAKGGERAPHVLVASATPIPRTLTLSLYGDLDVSILDSLPPGRRPVRTHWKPVSARLSVYNGVRQLLDEGRQAYVVCPAIEEDPDTGVRAAAALAEELQSDWLREYRVALVHGRMPDGERRDAMERFRSGEAQVLVATTVIEVGVDVPNAVAMVIEDADRFGLAQLHQLRGRVGRGAHASFCILLSDAQSTESRSRMEAMVTLADGFAIAEEDLRQRGAGEFFGLRQSGTPPLRFARLPDDVDVMAWAREDAGWLLTTDPELSGPGSRLLGDALRRRELAVELQATA